MKNERLCSNSRTSINFFRNFKGVTKFIKSEALTNEHLNAYFDLSRKYDWWIIENRCECSGKKIQIKWTVNAVKIYSRQKEFMRFNVSKEILFSVLLEWRIQTALKLQYFFFFFIKSHITFMRIGSCFSFFATEFNVMIDVSRKFSLFWNIE